MHLDKEDAEVFLKVFLDHAHSIHQMFADICRYKFKIDSNDESSASVDNGGEHSLEILAQSIPRKPRTRPWVNQLEYTLVFHSDITFTSFLHAAYACMCQWSAASSFLIRIRNWTKKLYCIIKYECCSKFFISISCSPYSGATIDKEDVSGPTIWEVAVDNLFPHIWQRFDATFLRT